MTLQPSLAFRSQLNGDLNFKDVCSHFAWVQNTYRDAFVDILKNKNAVRTLLLFHDYAHFYIRLTAVYIFFKS